MAEPGPTCRRRTSDVRRLDVAYEEWAMRGEHPNLASYYLIDAVR